MTETMKLLLVLTGTILAENAAAASASETGGPWKLGDIVVEQAWARVVPGGARTGAVYLTIHNKSGLDDLLLAVDSSAARSTAIHKTEMKDGVASMEPLPIGLPMPSHGEVVMRPGGMHIMLTGVSEKLTPENSLPVKMIFQDAGSLEFEVPIVPFGSGDPTENHLKH
jgi:copper(I)-binding protein